MARGSLRRGRELIPDGIGLLDEEAPKKATSSTLWGNDAPLELEVGSGKGTFLLSEAVRRPEVNFLGLERARRYWIYAADRLRRGGCNNVRLVLTDAVVFIRDRLPDTTVSSAHVYFPDPWPKTKHNRRRFIQPANVEMLAGKLLPGSQLRVVTDHLEYFEQIQQVLRASSLEVIDYTHPAAAGDDEMVGSNFERKYRREGRPIYPIAALKA